MTIKDWQKAIHEYAVSKGWWPDIGAEEGAGHVSARALGDQVANFHSELSEAWEEYRNGRPLTEVRVENGKPEGFPIELADCVIRILDTCEAYGIDLEKALEMKHAYNLTRPVRHGGKRA